MNQYARMIHRLTEPDVVCQLGKLYGCREGQMVLQHNRHELVLVRHEKAYHADAPVSVVSAPGRTEIGGNHTDHNKGLVLAASVNLDTLAAVSPREDKTVRVRSEGYPDITLDLSDLEMREAEKGTTASLIRGVAARMAEMGYRIGGFDAMVTSTVASGSGLSSSAAFEVLTAAILDRLYNGSRMDFVTQAQIGQYAENVYFGKPSGLLDQMASAAGGLVTVDFGSEEPKVQRLTYDFAGKGYALVVVATGGSHADLTADYAAIPQEMKAVAGCFGQPVLRRVRPEEFAAAIPQLRGKVSDRAIMRAMHFYAENDRVKRQVDALRRDDLPAFFRAVIESGRSSFMYLQNVWARPEDQSLSLALALAEDMLEGRGAWRVHGGGFAGTTLNFVPTDRLEHFVSVMEETFGARACSVLDIRPVGSNTLEI